MFPVKRIKMNNKEYDHYVGMHWELRDMLKVGDIVTLRRENANNTESIEIIGTVNRILNDNVFVLVDGIESSYRLYDPDNPRFSEFLVMLIKRPVNAKLPDHAGLWRDRYGNVWVVNNNLNALRIKSKNNGNWDFRGFCSFKDEYRTVAPFTELTITEKENDDER